MQVLAWPVTSGEVLLRWVRDFAENGSNDNWPSAGSLFVHQETQARGVVMSVDLDRKHVDVQYMRSSEDLETQHVPVTDLTPVQRSSVQAGMTLQRQFSGLVNFNPTESEESRKEAESHEQATAAPHALRSCCPFNTPDCALTAH